MVDMKTYKPPMISTSTEENNILPSCADMFVYYKKCMKQCSELSNGQVNVCRTLIVVVLSLLIYQHPSMHCYQQGILAD